VAAELLMRHSLLLLKASHRLSPCAVDDASLPIDKLMGVPGAPRVLLAVTGAAEGAQALPTMVLQLLQVRSWQEGLSGWNHHCYMRQGMDVLLAAWEALGGGGEGHCQT
jgi:hypothetical protein